MPRKYTRIALICTSIAMLMAAVSLGRAVWYRESFFEALPHLAILMLAVAIDCVLIVVLLGKKG